MVAAIGTFLFNYLKDLQNYMSSSFKNISIFDEEKYRDYDKNPFYMLGSMTYLFWIITVASGILLVFWYIPTPEQAYSSILHIQHEVPFGWLIRGFHKYGADALIVALTMRIYRIYFNAEYKKSFMVWLFAILGLVLAMYSGLTGYLLIWNQRAFWATKVFATFPTYLDALPIVDLTNFGKNISHILLGGASIGSATMTRFYGGHYMLSFITLIFIELYFWKRGGRRINLNWKQVTFFTGILALVAFVLPAELGSRSDAVVTPNPILSDWYFLALYQIMKYMAPLTATLWTALIPVVALLIPLFDRGTDVSWKGRIFWNYLGIMAMFLWILFSILIINSFANLDRDPPYWYLGMMAWVLFTGLWQWGKTQWGRLGVYAFVTINYLIFYVVIVIVTHRQHWLWHPMAVVFLISFVLSELYYRNKYKAVAATTTPAQGTV